jgi:hypothetical protein
MVQSRGSELLPNWIFAALVHTKRSLFRRFCNMSIPGHRSMVIHSAFRP